MADAALSRKSCGIQAREALATGLSFLISADEPAKQRCTTVPRSRRKADARWRSARLLSVKIGGCGSLSSDDAITSSLLPALTTGSTAARRVLVRSLSSKNWHLHHRSDLDCLRSGSFLAGDIVPSKELVRERVEERRCSHPAAIAIERYCRLRGVVVIDNVAPVWTLAVQFPPRRLHLVALFHSQRDADTRTSYASIRFERFDG